MSDKAFPTYDIFEKSKEIPKEVIEEVRQKFLELAKQKPELYYPADVERVKNDDWTVRRYIYRDNKEPDVQKGLEAIDNAMKWRKEFGVMDIKETDFPREMFLMNGAMVYCHDKNGSPVLISRAKMGKKSKTWLPVSQKMAVYYLEKYDRENEGKGLTTVVDCRKCIPKNIDPDAMKLMKTIIYDYYPGLVTASLVFKLPAVLEGIYKMFRGLLSDEQNKYIYMVDKKTVLNYISLDQLPEFMKGTNPKPFVYPMPEGMPSLHQVAEREGIKKEKADKMAKWCQKWIEAQ